MSTNRKRLLVVVSAVVLILGVSVALYVRALRKDTVPLPVLMYHHLDQVAGNDWVVTPEQFETQMRTISENGWHSVTVDQLIACVDEGAALPEKPVLITFDDGYTSNLEIAAPILEKYGLHGVIFVVGINAGQQYYAHTGEPLTPPRFALEEAREWIDRGVIELASHTYDMHQDASQGWSGHDGVLAKEDESEEEYRQKLTDDMEKERALFREKLGIGFQAFSFPFGFFNEKADEILKSEGIRLTVTTNYAPNLIRKGDPDSLHLLNRYTITDRTTPEELLGLLNWKKGDIVEKVLRHLGINVY